MGLQDGQSRVQGHWAAASKRRTQTLGRAPTSGSSDVVRVFYEIALNFPDNFPFSRLSKLTRQLYQLTPSSQRDARNRVIDNLVDLKDQLERAEEWRERNLKIVEKYESEL